MIEIRNPKEPGEGYSLTGRTGMSICQTLFAAAQRGSKKRDADGRCLVLGTGVCIKHLYSWNFSQQRMLSLASLEEFWRTWGIYGGWVEGGRNRLYEIT